MKAGKTQIDVNTCIRITGISDKDDQVYIGMEGKVTHPFPGLMMDSPDQYSVGVYLDPNEAVARGLGLNKLGQCQINLMIYDSFEVVEDGCFE